MADLPARMCKLKHVGESLTEEERSAFLQDSYQNLDEDVDFELFLRVRFSTCEYSYMLVNSFMYSKLLLAVEQSKRISKLYFKGKIMQKMKNNKFEN